MSGAVATVLEHPEWKLLVEAKKEAPYGHEFTHDEAAQIMHMEARTRRYYQQMRRARDFLRDSFQREVECVVRQGYRLVNPDEFHRRYRRNQRLSNKELTRGLKVLFATPTEYLTEDDAARIADALAKAGALLAFARKTLRDTRPSLPAPKVETPKMLK